MTQTMNDSDDPKLSYSTAMSELESILEDLEGDDLDVDDLADKVGRAAHLIDHCRSRIERARTEVERVVVDLDSNRPENSPQPDTDANQRS